MIAQKIALIGLEASGKTVLMTVLAKQLSKTLPEGYYLDPQGISTMRYVDKTWNILQHRDWPPSTPPGEMFKLKWHLHITPKFTQSDKSIQAEFRLIDAAGQDMRQLFSSDDAENVPSYLSPLSDYCMNADILLVALNIKDYVGESDSERASENHIIIKSALDRLQKPNQRVALIFTQMDQYKSYINDHFGGLDKFCEDKLTYINNAYIDNPNKVAIFEVAAVNDTEIVEKEDGITIRAPKPNFSSIGLENLGKWLAKQVVAIYIKEKVYDLVAKHSRVERGKIEDSSYINKDLGFDSLEIKELIINLEEEFNIKIPEEAVYKIKTVGDIIASIEHKRL